MKQNLCVTHRNENILIVAQGNNKETYIYPTKKQDTQVTKLDNSNTAHTNKNKHKYVAHRNKTETYICSSGGYEETYSIKNVITSFII
jgi:hypothetical protein